MKNKVEFCVPPRFDKSILDYGLLREKTKKDFQYASKGRYSIYHILVSLGIKRGLLLPAYFCETILGVLNMLKMPYQFYDLELTDLNPDVHSIEKKLQLTGYDAVLVPSFYGHAANLQEIDLICKKYDARMIDDAAQSFGAIGADGKMVGTYGAGGLVAFSPGKSTMAHMGSLYWTSNVEYRHQDTHHDFYHFLSYVDFVLNRQYIYKTRCMPLFSLCGFYHKLLDEQRLINDTIAKFESGVLGGCIKALFDEKYEFYDYYWNYFYNHFSDSKHYRIIHNVYGKKSVPRKIVLLFVDEGKCAEMKECLRKGKIAFFAGYNLLPGDYSAVPNTLKIVNHVVELPIEDNAARMKYIFDVVSKISS